MEKILFASRMTVLKFFVPLSRSCSTSASDIIQKTKNSVLLRSPYSLSQRIIHTSKSEKKIIGNLSPATIQLKRNLSSAVNMSIAVYEEIKDLPNHPEKTLIDVREPDELKQTGVIPTSINIPLATVSDALNLSDDQFKEKYGRTKPSKTSEIIFSCRSGMRAGKAAIAAAGLGYENVKNYKGSWTDWAEHEGLPA